MTSISLKYEKYVAGKDFGESLRKELRLPEIDKADGAVSVIIPNGFSCDASFIEGLFTSSVVHFGSRAKFLDKYNFPNDMSPALIKRLEDMINYALRLIK